MNPAFVDGLDEARRGLWRSAVESFAAAAEASPAHPAPTLAQAVCLLELGRALDAVVLLETASALQAPAPEWQDRITWLTAAARLAAGDPQGADHATAALPISARRYARAVILFACEEWAEAVAALIEGRRPPRVIQRPRERPPR